MINWMNGHNPGFKAMVCHDGIFSTTSAFFTTEEIWFSLQYATSPSLYSVCIRLIKFHSDQQGSPIDNRLGYEKWNPMNHVAEWETPTLVIHSAKDYRLVDGEGIGESPSSHLGFVLGDKALIMPLAAFTALQ